MSDAIVYVDISKVREGALDELKAGLMELAEFIEANEPRLIAYNIYFSDDGTKMTVVNSILTPLRSNTTWRSRGRSFAGSWSS